MRLELDALGFTDSVFFVAKKEKFPHLISQN